MFQMFNATLRALQLGMTLTARTIEMTAAANAVMTTRLGLMGAAALDPRRADHAELGRMVPEKMLAFSQAGSALTHDWLTLNRQVGDTMFQLGRTMMSGRPPNAGDAVKLAGRSASHAAGMLAASAAALAPVHRKATANAKRLARKRGRRRRAP